MRIVQIRKKRRSSVAVLVLAIGLSGLVTKASAQPEDTATSTETERVVEAIREAYDEAREVLEQLPRERFETVPVLEANDYDTDTIVTWVERNTRWVPYRGVLRGADGVLLDRQGNSLDRSLLLARLLEGAGYDTRLARGRLSAEATEAVLSLAAATVEEAQSDEPLFPDDMIAAAERAPSEANALADLVGTLPDHVGPEMEDTADHWWVEAQLDDGWSAIDPLLSGPLAAMRPDPLQRFSAESLPDSLFHKVTVRVVIERWDAGETVEEVPLEHTLRAAEATYHDLELQFVPYHFAPAPDGSTAAVEAEAVAETAEEWLPVLSRGSDTIQQQGFDRQGNLERDPGRMAIARKAEAAASALQGLGRSDDEPDPSHLSALWLEYRVEVPEREPKIVRREIFDLVGPPRRRSGAVTGMILDTAAIRERGRLLLGTHRILVTSADLPPIALEKAAWEQWANHAPQMAALVRLMQNPGDEEILQRAYREPLIALDLLGLATARLVLSPHRSSIYLASPNVLSTHFTVELEDAYSIRHAFDLVVNDVGVIANGSVPAGRIRLEQGVLDTILEAAMLDPNERSGSTADLFARRDGATGGWRRVDAKSSDLVLPDTARARIADALAAGRIVVAPSRLGHDEEPAWWEIDSATGTTLGIGPRGWGTVAENTVRGIAALGLRQGGRRYFIQVSCTVLHAYLKYNRWIFQNISGGLTYTIQAIRLLMARGCSVVV